VELFDRIDHPRISWSASHAGALQSIGPAFRPSGRCGPDRACRSHHVDHAGGEAERTNTMSPKARSTSNGRKPSQATPRQQRRRSTPKKAGNRAPSPRLWPLRLRLQIRLVSPDFAAVPNFGQPVIQTSEPCGKRSFVGRRLIATSISVIVRVARHVVDTRNDAAVDGNDAPSPLKPRGPY